MNYLWPHPCLSGQTSKWNRKLEANMNSRQRRALLVLGGPGSGSSRIADFLTLLGAEPPMAKDTGLPMAGWLGDLNRNILASAGSRLLDWAPFPAHWHLSFAADGFREDILESTRENLAQQSSIVLEAKGLSCLAHFWSDALDNAGYASGAIHVHCEPGEVVEHLFHHAGISREIGVLIWLRQALAAEHATRALPRSFIRYRDFARNWAAGTQKLSDELALAWPRGPKQIRVKAEDFWKEQPEDSGTAANTLDTDQMPDWVRTVSGIFDRWSNGAEAHEDRKILDKVRAELDTASSVFLPVIELHSQTQDSLSELESALADMRQELSAAQTALEAGKAEIEQIRGDATGKQEQSAATEKKLSTEMDELQVQMLALQKQILTQDKENRVLRGTAGERGDRITVLDEALEDERAKARELNSALTQAEAALHSTSEEASTLNETLKKTEADLENMTARADQLEADFDKTQSELRQRQHEAEQTALELKQVQAELEKTSKALEELQAEQAEELQDLQAQRQDLQAQRQDLQTKLEKTSDVVNTVQDLQEQRQKLQAELDDTARKFVETQTRSAKEIETLQGQRQVLQGNLDTYQHKLAVSVDEVITLTTLLKTLSDEKTGLTVQINALSAEKIQLSDQVHHLETIAQRFSTIAGSAETEGSIAAQVNALIATMLPLARRRFLSQKAVLNRQVALIRATGVLDPDWYGQHYPDICDTGISPEQHFILYGNAEGRAPNPLIADLANFPN
jgi:chromosome segregation ATPase